METQNTEIIPDHRTRLVDLFSHQIYNLSKSDCARVLNQSLGCHHESCIKQLKFIPSGKLTPVQSSLRVGGRCYKL